MLSAVSVALAQGLPFGGVWALGRDDVSWKCTHSQVWLEDGFLSKQMD